MGEEDLSHEIAAAADASLFEDALQVLVNGVDTNILLAISVVELPWEAVPGGLR